MGNDTTTKVDAAMTTVDGCLRLIDSVHTYDESAYIAGCIMSNTDVNRDTVAAFLLGLNGGVPFDIEDEESGEEVAEFCAHIEAPLQVVSDMIEHGATVMSDDEEDNN